MNNKRETSLKYYYAHKEDNRNAHRTRYAKDKDNVLAINKKWRDKPSVKERTRLYHQSAKGRFSLTKNGALRRDIPFKLTLEQFSSFEGAKCRYCGDLLSNIGLDRIDSSGGYTIDNVVPCCAICNTMKSTLTVEQFINHCKKVISQ